MKWKQEHREAGSKDQPRERTAGERAQEEGDQGERTAVE
jgi:hypothetical protein